MIERRSQQKYDGYCGRSEVARACLTTCSIGCATDVGTSYAMSPRVEGAGLGNHGTRADVGESSRHLSSGTVVLRAAKSLVWTSSDVRQAFNVCRRSFGCFDRLMMTLAVVWFIDVWHLLYAPFTKEP